MPSWCLASSTPTRTSTAPSHAGCRASAEPPKSFVEILEKVWWRLDRALDQEAVYLSGLVGAIEAARSGTTVLFDHHASPSFVRGSLATLRRAVEEVGLRSVLCYETTDRNGLESRDAGIAENEAFLATEPSALTRGLVGAHASFTLADESLDRPRRPPPGTPARACTSMPPRTGPTSRTARSAPGSASSSACGATGSSRAARSSSTACT